MSQEHPAFEPSFSVKAAAEAFNVPIGVIREGLASGGLRMRLIPSLEYKLLGSDVAQWLKSRAAESGGSR